MAGLLPWEEGTLPCASWVVKRLQQYDLKGILFLPVESASVEARWAPELPLQAPDGMSVRFPIAHFHDHDDYLNHEDKAR